MDQLSINSQFKSCIRYCAEHATHGIVNEIEGGVAIYWTQSTLITQNGFFLSSAVSGEEDLRRRLEGINTYVKDAQPAFQWMFIIEPELLTADLCQQAREICLKAGLVHHGNALCMQTARLHPPVRALPTAEITFATSDREVYDALLLNAEAYNEDVSVARNVVEHRAVISDFEKQICCVVSVDGKPVATATTMVLDECLYVVLVATSPQYRKYGYAEAAMRASIERALEKSPKTKYGIVLHSSELGRPVYQRMGFKDVSHVEMYIQKPTTPV